MAAAQDFNNMKSASPPNAPRISRAHGAVGTLRGPVSFPWRVLSHEISECLALSVPDILRKLCLLDREMVDAAADMVMRSAEQWAKAMLCAACRDGTVRSVDDAVLILCMYVLDMLSPQSKHEVLSKIRLALNGGAPADVGVDLSHSFSLLARASTAETAHATLASATSLQQIIRAVLSIS